MYWICNASDWIKFILWNNQSLHYSRAMCWLQPQILRHFTALRPERKIWSFSQVVWVIRNSDSTTIFLGVLKYWKPSCIVFLFRESEILYPLLSCLGDLKFWISSVQFGDQKFWILSCVVWWSEILNLLCCLGVRNSESPVLIGGQKFWILSRVVWGIRNSESPVLFGGQKSWILSTVLGESEIQNPLPCCLGDH